MADMNRRDIRARLLQLAHDAQWHGWERAELGVLTADGRQQVHAPGRPGWVSVRIMRGNYVTTTVALNTKVRNTFGLKVWVGPNEEGLLSVMGMRESETVNEVGASAPALALPEVATTGLIGTRRLQTGLVVPMQQAGVYTMSVYAYPFSYVYKGALGYFPGGWIDLTDAIPDEEGKQRWALVYLDPIANTLALEQGEPYGLPITLGASELAQIDPAGQVPLAGVKLFYGMSAVDNESLFLDARPLVTGDWGGAGALGDLSDVDLTTVAPVTGDVLTYDGDEDVWVPAEPGGGAEVFTDLADTPDAYTGAGGKFVRVTAEADGLMFQAGAPDGAESFTDLNDVPASYIDQAGKLVAVADTEDALEFVDAPSGGGNLTRLAQVIVGTGGAASVTFSDISGSYENLVIHFQARGAKAATVDTLRLQLNGDTNNNYSSHNYYLLGNSQAAYNNLATAFMVFGDIAAADAPANNASIGTIRINNYARTTFNKHVQSSLFAYRDTGAGDVYSCIAGGRWANTAAVTSLTIWLAGGNIVEGSVFTLYGES